MGQVPFIFALMLALLSPRLHANTLEVCNSCELISIQEAVDRAKNHDTIRVLKGEYKEYNIKIDKPLTLIGIDYPVIDGEKKVRS